MTAIIRASGVWFPSAAVTARASDRQLAPDTHMKLDGRCTSRTVTITTHSNCRLCKKEATLRESHIIPAFVAKWLKDTSATGYLRTFHAPNRRVQDFRTVKLLCEECEQRLSLAEGKFARSVFLPFHAGRSRFAYDEWLLQFAVSLAWRCSVTSDRSELQRYPQHIDAVESAQHVWADFLLGRATRVAPYRFNIFFTPLGVTSDDILPEGLSSYLLRAPDGTPVYSRARTAVYVKLPGMFLWASIAPPDPGGWKGTKIGRRGTLQSRNQSIKEPGVGEFLKHRVETVHKKMGELSPKQKRRIEDTVLRNPERAAVSRTIGALLDDERIRSENRKKPRAV